MQQQHGGIPQLEYRFGDIRSLPEYEDGAFRSVLDKGTLDAILCGADAFASAAAALAECCRRGSARGEGGGEGPRPEVRVRRGWAASSAALPVPTPPHVMP
jgi:hypothetical protein